MKKNKVILNGLVAVLAVVYTAILILGNVARVSVPVAVVEDSYAAEYADKNDLTVVELSDSNQQYFDQRYELFDYNVDEDGITLEGYEGASINLVIPEMISGTRIVAIGEEFFETLNDVESVYLPSGLNEIAAEPVNDIVLYCNEDSEFYQENIESDWKIETVYDSEFVNRYLGTLEFDYNDNNGEIEITDYFGENQEVVVIPSYINGNPVTEVSMNLLGRAEVVVIPETVTSITGETVKHLYSAVLVIEIAFTILAFLLALVSVNVILPRYKEKEEYFLSGSQMATTVLYVIAQFGFSIYAIYFSNLSAYIALIVSIVFVVVFVVLLLSGGKGRTHSKKVTENIAVKTQRMKQLKVMAKNLADDVKDKELRKKVQRLEEEIRYSDPVTNASLDVIEEKIEEGLTELKKAIGEENVEAISMQTDVVLKMIRERNVLCKSNK